MTDIPNKSANQSAAARQARLGQALRDNLKRRKSQLRGRASLASDTEPAETSAASDREDICSRPADPDRD